VTGAAANLGGLGIQDGYHRMVHDALAAYAEIVDIVAQTHFAHKWVS